MKATETLHDRASGPSTTPIGVVSRPAGASRCRGAGPTAVPGRDPVATCARSIGTMRIRTPHRAESRVASTPSSVTLRLSDPLFGTADARVAAREMTSVVNVVNGKGCA